MAVKSTSNVRTLNRGETQKFEVSFFEDEAKTIPITSSDLTKYPAYTIYDVENNTVTTGIGTFISVGNWYALWAIPITALLSSDNRNYRIEWDLVDTTDRQFNFVQEFDVVDLIIEESENPEQQLYTMVNEEFQFLYRTKVVPYDVTLTVIFGQNESTPVIENISKEAGNLETRTDGIWQVWYYKPSEKVLTIAGCYTAVWRVTETENSTPVTDFQIINVIPMAILQFIPSVRMVVDKMQKKIETIQAYQDSDIIQYLMRGLQFINSWFPTTYYDVNNIPPALQMHWVMASSWYGLNAQHLLEVELQYDFSGQIDSFTFDHASGIESVLSRIMEYFSSTLGSTKNQIFRTSHRVGVGAFRLSSYRGYGQNFVYPLRPNMGVMMGNIVVMFGL